MASNAIEVRIRGREQVIRSLRELPKNVRGRVVRQAVREGMKAMKGYVSANMPVDTGVARGALVVRASRLQKRGRVFLEVRYDTDKIYESFSTYFYPTTIEYGSAKLHRAPVAPMRRAFDAHARSIRRAVTGEIARGVDREAAREAARSRVVR